MISAHLSAHYFDGRSARLHAVQIDLSGGVIALAGDGILRSYRYADARLAELFAQSPCVLDFSDGARCELGPEARAELVAALGYRESSVQRWQRRWWAALLALVLLVASVGAAIKWGVPALAERVVAAMPASVDIKVGDAALKAVKVQMFQESRLSDQRIAEVEAIFRGIVPASTRLPLTLLVLDMPKGGPNAMALPNGTIIMTDAMVRQILGEEEEFDDEMRAALAGVLAHEIGHVQGRHSMRALARSSMMALVSGTLFGDFSSVAALAPVLLIDLDYSRDMERAADDYAITRLHANGMRATPLAELFDSLAKDDHTSELPKWMRDHASYLSSHPATAERSARFRASDPELTEDGEKQD